MQFIKPIKFKDAIDKLGARSPIGAQLSSRQWSAVPVALRERAVFSANIESVRFLQDMQNNLRDFLEANRDSDTGALKIGSRAKFIENMRRQAIALGLGPLDPEDVGTIKDIRSERRLGLIFDVNTKAAHSFGDRKQGLDSDVLNEFPGQRFIRVIDVKEPRTSHEMFEGQVFLKTDTETWLRINQDFGVPWGPWGWGCGHDVEDVDRDETDSLGLTKPGQRIEGAHEDFNENLKASARNLDPDLIRFLREKFGNKIQIENGEARWNPAAPKPPEVITPPPALPSPGGEGQGEGEQPNQTVQKSWQQSLESIANEYKDAHYTKKAELRDQARDLISVPEKLRQTVKVTPGVTDKSIPSQTVEKIAEAGNAALARFVRPQLTQKTEIHVFHTKDSRAFYRHDQKGVYLNVGSDLSTAAHEIMHAIELQNPAVLKAAAEFLLSRRRLVGAFELPEQPQPLKKLTGLPYSAFEIAIEDDWIKKGGTVYAGKVYVKRGRASVLTSPDIKWSDIDATEVLTTGIERLLADPIDFYRHDPDWFHFMVETIGIGKSL
jgi:hypothetical protein